MLLRVFLTASILNYVVGDTKYSFSRVNIDIIIVIISIFSRVVVVQTTNTGYRFIVSLL